MFTLIDSTSLRMSLAKSRYGYDPYNSADRPGVQALREHLRSEADANRALYIPALLRKQAE